MIPSDYFFYGWPIGFCSESRLLRGLRPTLTGNRLLDDPHGVRVRSGNGASKSLGWKLEGWSWFFGFAVK
jgi:hypothetical protein